MIENNMWIIYVLIAATIVCIHLMCAFTVQSIYEESKRKGGFRLGLLFGVVGLIIAIVKARKDK